MAHLPAAGAQGSAGSAKARAAQYVFIVDDSGSMSKTVRGQRAADSDRLAVFAVRSILSMLDAQDEATVVALNAPSEGRSIPAIEPLSDNRRRLEQTLALDGPIAAYDGQNTPCRQALSAVKERLKEAHRPGVAQVVMFLTDGACTGGAPRPSSFLKGLPSVREDLFKFYLLRFEGRDYTRSLETIANRTGGSSIKVSASDPASILHPFASALTRSQGYRAYVLTPDDHRLAAHSGARRVRLLGVAPGRGDELSFAISSTRKGETPQREGGERTGLHQYENGRAFRYAALDYRPGTTPVSIQVKGAGDDWKVIAVPDYRLFLEMDIHAGKCGGKGQPTQTVEVGASACAEIRLVNEEGEVVGSDVAGPGTEAVMQYQGPEDEEPRKLPASSAGGEARWRLMRVNLTEGDHILNPTIDLKVPGAEDLTVNIDGSARTLQVSSRNISAEPKRLDLETLEPGQRDYYALKVDGNFKPAKARLVLQNRSDIPECVDFQLGDKKSGGVQRVAPGQEYTVGVDVEPYCGPTSFEKPFDTALRLEFDKPATGGGVPTLVLPLSFTLANKVEVPRGVEVDMTAGQQREATVALGGNFQRDATFKVFVNDTGEGSNWPGGDLQIALLDEAGEPMRNGSALADTREITFPAGGSAEALRLRVQSETCCGGGTYTTEMALLPQNGSGEPVRVPIEATIASAGVLACWGWTILGILALILLALMAAYAWNMWRNTHLIEPGALAGKLKPLAYDGNGGTKPSRRLRQNVEPALEKKFQDQKWERFKAWWEANPFKFGLPGGKYEETVEIGLAERAPVDNLWLEFQPRRDSYGNLKKHPEEGAGMLFATARGGIIVFGIPNGRGRIGRFEVVDGYGMGGGFGGRNEEGKVELEKFKRKKLLKKMDRLRKGDLVGWEIG